MVYRILVVTIFSFLFLGAVNAQSKKEQIVILSHRIDSLNLEVKAINDLSTFRIQSLTSKIDSLSQVRNLVAADLKLFNMELEKSNKEISLLMFKNDSLAKCAKQLTEQNTKMQNEFDSIIDVQTEFFISIEPEMIYVQGGTFLMTDGENSEDNPRPFLPMTVSSYLIGKYEVTQAQWRSVMGSNPSAFSGCDDCPVESVSWLDIREFLRRLNARTGKHYRLPTGAEWEFAFQGGVKSKGYKYSGSNDIEVAAWFGNNCTSTQKVGTKKSNELGIYDLSGNVREMISDSYYQYKLIYEPNTQRVLKSIITQAIGSRGGSWNCDEFHCRTTFHLGYFKDSQSSDLGFRLAHSTKMVK